MGFYYLSLDSLCSIFENGLVPVVGRPIVSPFFVLLGGLLFWCPSWLYDIYLLIGRSYFYPIQIIFFEKQKRKKLARVRDDIQEGILFLSIGMFGFSTLVMLGFAIVNNVLIGSIIIWYTFVWAFGIFLKNTFTRQSVARSFEKNKEPIVSLYFFLATVITMGYSTVRIALELASNL